MQASKLAYMAKRLRRFSLTWLTPERSSPSGMSSVASGFGEPHELLANTHQKGAHVTDDETPDQVLKRTRTEFYEDRSRQVKLKHFGQIVTEESRLDCAKRACDEYLGDEIRKQLAECALRAEAFGSHPVEIMSVIPTIRRLIKSLEVLCEPEFR